MTIKDGTAIVLAYVLVSMGVIIAFLLAAFVIGWFIGRLRQRPRGSRAWVVAPQACGRPQSACSKRCSLAK
jgi:biotin transporter BioY